LTPTIMDALAKEARRLIIDRTLEGKGVEGARLAGYDTKALYVQKSHRPAPKGGIATPQTSRKISNHNAIRGAREGMRAKALARKSTRGGKSVFYPGGYKQYKAETTGTSTPNLSDWGTMFIAMGIKVTGPLSRTLYFMPTKENDKAAGNNETREFFDVGLIPSEVEALRKKWEAMNG
jgi:hypothetical protein